MRRPLAAAGGETALTHWPAAGVAGHIPWRRFGRLLTVMVMVAIVWVVLVWLPFVRIAWSFMSGAGSTPLELLLPADPMFRLETQAEGSTVTATGQTSLPSGSQVELWATHWGDAPGIHISDSQNAVVHDGVFTATFDLAGWPAGPIAVTAVFAVHDDQPPEVIARYGADGSGLSGPRVAFDDDMATWAVQDWQTIWVGPRERAEVPPLPPVARDAGAFGGTGPMSAFRSGHAATLLLDGRVLVTGGDTRCDETCVGHPTADVYDPASGTFTPANAMAVSRDDHTATPLPDGRVLVAGGYDGNFEALQIAELFDPSTGEFVRAGLMTSPRAGHSATLLPDGRVLLVGGVGSVQDGSHDSAELFDPQTATFARTGSMRATRSGHSATSLVDGRVLVAGGSGDLEALASAEVYDPARDSFAPAGAMAVIRELHGAALLADGRVLVAGGIGPEDQWQLASAEVYDPASDTFSAVGPMAQGRNFLTATRLADGRVLIAGGVDRGESVALAELFDPATGTFAPVGDLRRASSAPTATLLLDGRVLIAGGDDNDGGFEPWAELYDPTP